MPLPFIILADLRTGSTLLSTTLNTHPDIRCLGELFHPEDLPDNCPSGINRYHASGAELIRHAFDTRQAKASGFKAMIFLPTADHPRWSDAWHALENEPNLHVICLVRKNVLAQYTSWLIAQQTGKFHPSPGDPVLEPDLRPRVKVDPFAFRQWKMQRRRLLQHRLGPLRNKPLLKIEYTDLHNHWDSRLAQILDFLKAEPIPLAPAKAKQEKRPLSHIIENYAQLEYLGLI